jgi:hypothetical protein
MAHGGKRSGSGRKPGTASVKTREIADRALIEGVTPLEVLLDNMRFYHAGAAEALADLVNGKRPTVEVAEGEDPDTFALIEGFRQVLGLRKMAGDEAARAAPYCHARQGYAGDERTAGDEEIPLAERLKEYQRRDDLKAAGSNVVDLKRPSDQ